MQFRDEIVRGVRLAGFAFAALLICLAIRRTIHFVGAADAKEPAVSAAAPELPIVPQAAPVVPPPPVPDTESVPAPPKKRPVEHKTTATVVFKAPVVKPIEAPSEPATPVVDLPSPETLTAAPAPKPPAVESSSTLAPITPVFVVPPEPPKQEARPKRWMKAVGKALHIGQKDDNP